MIQHNHDLEILKQMAMADGILTENEKQVKFYSVILSGNDQDLILM